MAVARSESEGVWVDREPLSQNDGLFLAGMFETSGSIGVNESRRTTRTGKRYSYYYPEMQYVDNRAQKLEALQNRFGGRVFGNSKNNSSTWATRSGDVVSMARIMTPYAPGRQEILQAIQSWSQTTN